MKRVALAAVAWLATSCVTTSSVGHAGTPTPPPGSVLTADIPAGATPVAGGCGATTIYRGPNPSWLAEAGGHNNPSGLPYAVAHPPIAAGFIFGYPLRAGHPTNPINKVLWVVRSPRHGSDLTIRGRQLGSSVFTVQETRPADSSPGEIYPSDVDVPTPGCWDLVLQWAGHTAEVELEFA